MFAKNFPVPAVQGNYYLRIQRTDQGHTNSSGQQPFVSIHLSGHDGPIATIPDVDVRGGNYSDFFARDQLGLDQRIYFIPAANVLITLPESNDVVLFRDLNLDAELEKSGIDYLFVTSSPPGRVLSGEAFEYQIETKSEKHFLQVLWWQDLEQNSQNSWPSACTTALGGNTSTTSRRTSDGEDASLSALRPCGTNSRRTCTPPL